MKIDFKIPLVLFLALFLGTANSKNILQDTVALGGDLNVFNSSDTLKSDDGSSYDRNRQKLSVSGLYFIKKNLGVGAYWNYENSESFNSGIREYSKFSSIGPSIYYNISIRENVSVGLSGGISKVSDSQGNGTTSINRNGHSFGVSGLVNYFLNDYISLYGGIGYYNYVLGSSGDVAGLEITGFNTRLGLMSYLH